MCQIMRRILKLMRIHSYQLVNTIQEKDEQRRVLLTIVNILPWLHLNPWCLKVGRNHLPVDLLAVVTVQQEGALLGKVVLEEDPLLVDECSQPFEGSIVWVDDDLREGAEHTRTVWSSGAVYEHRFLLQC